MVFLIVSNAYFKLAAQRKEAYLETQMGTITQFKTKKASRKN